MFLKSKQKQKYMPIEIGGQKQEPYIGLKGVKKRVTFKVSSAPLRAKTEDGMVEKPLASLSIPASYTRRSLNGGHETVVYYENKTSVPGMKGEINYRYTPPFIEIENGEIMVDTKGKPDLYWFLANHPDNEGNPIYDVESNPQDAKNLLESRRTPFQFFETDRQKRKKNEVAFDKDVEIAKCITLISDSKQLSDRNAVVLYKAFGYADADEMVELDDYTSIRKALVEQAKTDPALFNKKLESAALHLESQVNDAVNKGILVYEQLGTFNGWMWGTTSKEFKKKEICPILEHQYEERVELLIDFLRTNEKGIKVAQDIKSELLMLQVGK